MAFEYYTFIDKVFEIAFGEDAVKKGYTREEVLERLESFSNNALKLEEMASDGIYIEGYTLCEVLGEYVRDDEDGDENYNPAMYS